MSDLGAAPSAIAAIAAKHAITADIRKTLAFMPPAFAPFALLMQTSFNIELPLPFFMCIAPMLFERRWRHF